MLTNFLLAPDRRRRQSGNRIVFALLYPHIFPPENIGGGFFMASATSDFLLKGYAYSLEQCGALLRDANVLYRSRSYASAVVLVAFATEELGRSTIILKSRREVLAGSNLTLKELKKRCKDHTVKQEAGTLSTVLTSENTPAFAPLLHTVRTAEPHSEEAKTARLTLEQLHNEERMRISTALHKDRMASLYVDPKHSSWNRPAKIQVLSAFNYLNNAVEHYARRYYFRYVSEDDNLKSRDPELFAALQQWSDRPVLPPPEWPERPSP